jgi:hypothetical protein
MASNPFAPNGNNVFRDVINFIQVMCLHYAQQVNQDGITIIPHTLNSDFRTSMYAPGDGKMYLFFVVDATQYQQTEVPREQLIENFKNMISECNIHLKGGMSVHPVFYLVTASNSVIDWWNTFIVNEADKIIIDLGLAPPNWYVINAPLGPPEQLGLFEDQLINDIISMIWRILLNYRHWAARIVCVTADGNDRSLDRRYVPGVYDDAMGFPSYFDKVNTDFEEEYVQRGGEPYQVLVHCSPFELQLTSRSHKEVIYVQEWYGTRATKALKYRPETASVEGISFWPMIVDK